MDTEKKFKVYEAAKELFERFGYKKTTVDEIAAGAGISKRTLYEMFESKECILSELVMHEAFLLHEKIQTEINDIDNPLIKLERFTMFNMDYFANSPFLGKVLSDESGFYSPFLKDEIQSIEDGIKGIFQTILIEGTEKNVFRRMDHKASANCIFILFRSFTYANTLKPNQEWVQFIRNAITNDNEIE